MKKLSSITRTLLLAAGAACLAALPVFASGEPTEEVPAELPAAEEFLPAEDGSAQPAGWLWKDGAFYYYNADGSMVTEDWLDYGGSRYYLDADGKMVTGVYEVPGDTSYYFADSGKMSRNCWAWQDGRFYYFGSDGSMVTEDWLLYGGSWYYLGEDGAMATGIYEIPGDATYYFSAGGSMNTACWVWRDGKFYYFGGDGRMATGWLCYAGSWYYMGKDGAMATGVYDVPDDTTYYFTSGGQMNRNCWIWRDGKFYYFGADGRMVKNGWIWYGGSFYFLDEDGAMHTGWLEYGKNKYYLRDGGDMVDGWLYLDDHWYYFGYGGVMSVGWTIIGGYDFYFYTEDDENGGPVGTMAHDVTIDDTEIPSDGRVAASIVERMENYVRYSPSDTGYTIAVDTTSCNVGIFTGSYGNWDLLYFWQCAPGKDSTPTILGIYTIGNRGYYFDSGSARCYYYTQISGAYLFHSVLYTQADTHAGVVSDGRVGQRLSHGCVRLEIGNAWWIYNYIPRGTYVYIYE